MLKKITQSSLLFIAIATCIIACQSPDGKIINSSAKARLDSTLKAVVDAGQVAGVSALIFEKNKEVYFNAVGFADREKNIPMTRNTIVRIFSMTKPITGTALMQLHEQGKFNLDDPLSKFAPEFSDMKVFAGVDEKGNIKLEPAKRPITIRDLTRHTAGFADANHPQLSALVKEIDAANKENTLEQMAKKLATLPLAFHPGEQWAYGISVDVQAYLIEKISGIPFDEYVKKNILNPLQMSNTGYVPTDFKNFAAVYRQVNPDSLLKRIPDEEANVFNSKPWPMKPGGWGLTSTLDDYMRFAQMLVNKGTVDNVMILKPETVKLMSTNQLSDSIKQRMWLPSKGQVGFGIDFAVRLRKPANAEEKRGEVGEFFWDGAASTLFWVDPVNELTAVMFVQKFPFDNPLHKDFREAVYGKSSQ